MTENDFFLAAKVILCFIGAVVIIGTLYKVAKSLNPKN